VAGVSNRKQLLSKHNIPGFYVGQVNPDLAELAHDFLNYRPPFAELLLFFGSPGFHHIIWQFVEKTIPS